MRPARRLSEQDRSAWAQYITLLRPLQGRTTPGREPTPISIRPSADVIPTAAIARRAPARAIDVGVAPSGLDTATWQRFHTGRMAAERRVDLHGCTAHHAYRRFERAVTQAADQGLRCIEVITGRGAGEHGGILRRELPLWINLPHVKPLILAASHPHAANPGSVRLLLRRRR